MQAGKLKHRVELQRVDETKNGYGEAIRGFATYATVWAEIRPMQGREFEYGRQVIAEMTHKIIIRYDAEITPKDRIKFGDRIFELAAPPVNPEERNELLVLLCKEVV